MAVPVVYNWTAQDSGGGTVSYIRLTKPSGIEIGDLLLLIVGSDQGNTDDWNEVTGWTKFVGANSGDADADLACYWRIATGAEGDNVDVTAASSDERYGWYIVVTGANDTTPIHVVGTPQCDVPGGADHVINEIETTVDDCLAFYALAFDGGDGYPFGISGAFWQEKDDQQSGSGANDASGCWGTKAMASKGFTGDATVSANANDSSSRVQFAIAPPGGAAYELPADAGSFSLAGTAAALLVGFAVIAAAGSYALAGTDASVEYGRKVPAASGAYAFSGTVASLEYGRKVAANAGAYSLAGTAASLQYGRQFPVDSGSYAFTGTAATLSKGRTLDVAAGAYSMAGTAATFDRSYELAATAGSYAFTGSDVTLSKGRALAADSGTYSMAGTAVTFDRTYELAAGIGTYLFTGSAAGLESGLKLSAAAGAYSLSGTDVVLLVGHEIAASGGAYLFTGSDATLTYTPGAAAYTLDALPGTYAFTGTDLLLIYGRNPFSAEAGAFAFTGTAADLKHGRELDAESGSYGFDGRPAILSLGNLFYGFPVSGVWTLEHGDTTRWAWSIGAGILQGYSMPDPPYNLHKSYSPLKSIGGDPLNIPSDAEITGIKLEFSARGSKTELGDGGPYSVELWYRLNLHGGGYLLRTDPDVVPGLTPNWENFSIGGPEDLWEGSGLTPDMFNGVDFGLSLQGTSLGAPAPPWVNILEVGNIGFTVYYVPASGVAAELTMTSEDRDAVILSEERILVMESELWEAIIVPEDRMALMGTEDRDATLGDE